MKSNLPAKAAALKPAIRAARVQNGHFKTNRQHMYYIYVLLYLL